MRLSDTHCHLDLYPDYAGLIEEVERERIYTVAVTNTPSVFRRCLALTEGRRFIRAALGLHPQLVRQRHRELDLMIEMLGETRYIGEVGLDFVTKDDAERALQKEVFRKVLDRCAASGDKVLTIHSRRAAAEVVGLIGGGYNGTIILHWFSGPHKVLEKAVEQGYFFSVNPAMVLSAKGLELVAAIPRERVLTESDGPFVTVGEKPARPRDVGRVIAELAGIWNVSGDEAASRVHENFRTALANA